MPRKKPAAPEAAPVETNAAATAVAEPLQESDPSPMARPAYIDGPPVHPNGEPIVEEEQPKNWGNPYKAIVTANGFEMGEDRRFKQRLFMFRERPANDVLATLKENGFTYRPNENAWTIPANPDTRRLSDDLAQQFAGKSSDLGR